MRAAAPLLLALALALTGHAQSSPSPAALVSQMSLAEKVAFLHGNSSMAPPEYQGYVGFSLGAPLSQRTPATPAQHSSAAAVEPAARSTAKASHRHWLSLVYRPRLGSLVHPYPPV